MPGNEALRFALTYFKKKIKRKKRRTAKRYRTVQPPWLMRSYLVRLVGLHDRVKRHTTYDDILSLCYEAAWITIKDYKDVGADFHLYFIRAFRWKIARLLRRHLKQMANNFRPYSVQILTMPPIEDIIDYGRLNDWTMYLSWCYDVNGLTTRQVEKLTGLSKSLVAEEVKKLNADTW